MLRHVVAPGILILLVVDRRKRWVCHVAALPFPSSWCSRTVFTGSASQSRCRESAMLMRRPWPVCTDGDTSVHTVNISTSMPMPLATRLLAPRQALRSPCNAIHAGHHKQSPNIEWRLDPTKATLCCPATDLVFTGKHPPCIR